MELYYEDHGAGRHGTDWISKVVLAAAVPPYLFKSEDNPDGGLDHAAIAGFDAGVTGDRLAFLDNFTKAFFTAGDRDDLISEPQRQYAIDIAAFASPKGTLDFLKK